MDRLETHRSHGEEELGSDDDDACSVDSVEVDEVLEMCDLDEYETLHYLCHTTTGKREIFDRSDLMDGGTQQRLVLAFERRHPPPWDPVCTFCDGDGCEECVCEECERPMRHINGVNYGCEKHPVI